jgi:hypothetical protein
MRAPVFLAVLLVFFAALAAPARAYSDQFVIVNATFTPEGTAHVAETTVISLTSSAEVQAFENSIQTAASLTDWRRFSQNVGYHLNGFASDTRITGKRDVSLGVPVGIVIVDYTLNYSLAVPERQGSRITRYKLAPEVLNFPGPAGTNESTLLSGVTLTFKLPADATLVNAEPKTYERNGNTLSWKGALTGTWRLEYEREQPLGEEVNAFFADAYKNALGIIPLLLLGILLAFVAFKMVRTR